MDHHNKSEKAFDLQPTTSCHVGEYKDVENTSPAWSDPTGTQRNIKSRHSAMIAIGGIIGTGLFVGAGQGLAVAGPATLFLAYAIICFFVYAMVTATTEVCTYLPLGGSSMSTYASRYVSSSMGFALGWLYWYSFGIIVAYEITAAALVIDYWPNTVNVAVWITIMYIVVVGLNMSAVKVYAETEFWFASIKVIMIIGLLIMSFVLAVGGGPSGEAIGFRAWNNPGAFNEYLTNGASGRFCAFVYAIVFSMFSFVFGPELIVLTSGEMKNPRKNLPRTANTFVYRLITFYVLGSLAIGIICRSDAPGLVNGGAGAAASPWVIGIKDAGIRGLDSVINGGILISAWSSGNCYLYMSSRTLYSMSVAGNAPKIFSRCNRWGNPIYAVLISSLIPLLAYLNVSSGTSLVFNWFINLTNAAGFVSWICCCIILIRFRKACRVQGVTKLPYRSVWQPWASYVCIVFFAVLYLVSGFSVFFPGHWSTSTFITSYVGVPIFLLIYTCHRVVHRNERWVIPAEEADLHTGLDSILAMEEDEEETEKTSKLQGLRRKVKGAFA